MPDTRKYAKQDTGWKSKFKPGQSQWNQLGSVFVRLRADWQWESHFTVNGTKERVIDKFSKEHAVSMFHLTMEYKEGKTVIERPAMHWSYDSVTDRYKCLGWKRQSGVPTHGVVYDPATHALTPGIHSPELYMLAELPGFDPTPEIRRLEQGQVETQQHATILQIIDAKVDTSVAKWFGSAGVDKAKWQLF